MSQSTRNGGVRDPAESQQDDVKGSQPLRAPSSSIIGIDARAAAEVPAGRGRVVRELLRELAAREPDGHSYVLYARRAWQGAQLDERFRWHLVDARDPWWHALAARAANRECGVFLSSNSYLTAWFLRIPNVSIVYDLTTFTSSMRPNLRSTLIERATLGVAVRRSTAVLAISKATADALTDRFPAAASKTVVALLGIAPTLNGGIERVEAEALPAPGFVLAVGTLEPRKNLPRLVAAYSSLDASTQAQHPLVVVGALGWETGETLNALRSLGERCQMLGYVSDAALAELYRRCTVFCYPSLGEGFGLPVLEAMAAGAPVVTSRISSLPEVGGDAVEYVDPYRVAGIAGVLRAVLDDDAHRLDLAARSVVRAREFSWARFAAIVIDTLDAAAEHSDRPAGA
jgi:glycosyltransferase involved in cell wall biosynthesis